MQNTYNDNSLNLIRMLAATSVLIGHASTHLEIILPNFLKFVCSLFPGVPIFFFLSGFLIIPSIVRSTMINEYCKKRVLRLFPELWLCVLLTTVILLVIVRPVDILTLLTFTATQASIFQFWTPTIFRSYGCGTPNGSLWTMTVTIQFYIIAWPMYKLLRQRKIFSWIILVVFCLGLSGIVKLLCPYLPDLVNKLLNVTIIPYLWIFILGMFTQIFLLDIIKQFNKLCLISFVLLVAQCLLKIDIILSYGVLRTVLACLTWIGFAYAFPKLQVPDYSYGIYIYHMIIINLILFCNIKIKNIGFLGIVWLLSLILAVVSNKISKLLILNLKIKKRRLEDYQ